MSQLMPPGEIQRSGRGGSVLLKYLRDSIPQTNADVSSSLAVRGRPRHRQNVSTRRKIFVGIGVGIARLDSVNPLVTSARCGYPSSPARGTMLDSASCKTNGLGAELSNLVAGFDTGCSGYLLHRRSRHASLINCLGIPLNLAQAPMPTDGCNEVGATSRFCKTAARRLP